MSRIRIVGGNITRTTGGNYKIFSEENIEIHSNGMIIQNGGENGISFGRPDKAPAKTIEESEYKLESTYIHDHIKRVANEMTTKLDIDKESIVYKFYNEIADGNVVNPEILVSKFRFSNKLAFYEERNEKIIVWQDSLIDIEKDNDKKIFLAKALAEAYGNFINVELNKKLNHDTNVQIYEYDLFQFDAFGEQIVTVAKMQSPKYSGKLDISFLEEQNQKPKYNQPDKKERGGPNAGDFYEYDEENINAGNLGGPGDPIPNMAFVLKYSLGGGFSASICAGIQKNIDLGKGWGVNPGFNFALTAQGIGTPGTSTQSKSLFYLSASPSLTLGAKTGNTLPLNIFNQYTASGLNNSYEYAFTVGTTGVLSSGKVTSEYDKDGNRIKDPYNSHDHKNRHQIIGGAAIKVGNFMISSYNDIYKPPLFLGYNSDQYWSAGVNIQAKLTERIKMAYAFDLYYGKSNNKNPYALDKIIDGKNYDYQKLFDMLLNRGQETFSIFDEDLGAQTKTKFGYGTFWPSNNMHDAIPFPENPTKLKKLEKPVRSNYQDEQSYNEAVIEFENNPDTFVTEHKKAPIEPFRKDYKNDEIYANDKIQYDKDLKKYKEDVMMYDISVNTKANSTFHHIWSVYNEGSTSPNLERVKKFMEAEIPTKAKYLQEFYELDAKFKKIDDDKKANK